MQGTSTQVESHIQSQRHTCVAEQHTQAIRTYQKLVHTIDVAHTNPNSYYTNSLSNSERHTTMTEAIHERTIKATLPYVKTTLAAAEKPLHMDTT